MITHDRWFLDRIATHILACEGNGEVVWHEGNYQSHIGDLKKRKGPEGATEIMELSRMRRLARLRPLHIALACATWAAFVVLLPRLMLLALVVHFRVQALLSPAPNRGAAFGDAHWTSWWAMTLSAAVPPAALLGAWVVSRILYRGAAS